MVIAAREDLELILYDWDAPQLLGDPLPSFWSAEGTEEAVQVAEASDAPAEDAAETPDDGPADDAPAPEAQEPVEA